MKAPVRILIVGSGAREHALAWRLAGEPGVDEVHVAPGNAGMADVATTHPESRPRDLGTMTALAVALGADLVVVGPEAPLADGLADRLRAVGVAVFGPDRAAAALESSKSFCRAIAEASGIPMAEGAAFDTVDAALGFAHRLGPPLAVKADGLAAGKGVTLCPTVEAAERAIRAAIEGGAFGAAGRQVVIERQLVGPEASVMAICDGTTALALPPARDHKRVGDGDTGDNTGGMGAYSPLVDLPDEAAERIVAAFQVPALREMDRRGTPFRGLLYAGLILTTEGPRLLEFNVRFGDPEAQAVLPRVAVPLGPLLLAAAEGRLAEAAAGSPARGTAARTGTVPVLDEAAVAVVLAAPGYPQAPVTGGRIEGIEAARRSGALVFHAGTRDEGDRFATAGGRVLTVVGRGVDLGAARDRAYEGVAHVHFDGLQYRRDIAAPGVTLAGAPA